MSIWTSKAGPLACGAVFVLLLTGCLGVKTPGSLSAAARADASGQVATRDRLRVAKGDVVIAGPKGYCIDRASSQSKSSGAFVLLTVCQPNVTATPRSALPSVTPALLTATVLSGDGPTSVGYNRYFSSEAGRSALSKTGVAANVKVIEKGSRSDMFVMRIQDSDLSAQDGFLPDAWRGMFNLNGHIVALSVYSLSKRPLNRDAGYSLLETFAEAIRSESSVAPTTVTRNRPLQTAVAAP
ncbi:MAG: hypothetical protein ACI9IV_000409 [Paracoccaceae bacterium]|jgi:hypothetical protein